MLCKTAKMFQKNIDMGLKSWHENVLDIPQKKFKVTFLWKGEDIR
jgi:hypothetical protein